MAEKRVADILVEKLSEFGVKYIFGMPGDAVNPVVDAIRLQERVKLIVIRHEESAAIMASAYSKLTGKLSACLGTAGPGSIHLLNGLYDAKLDDYSGMSDVELEKWAGTKDYRIYVTFMLAEEY